MVVTQTHAKDQGHRSVGSKDTVQWKRTDIGLWMEAIALGLYISHANAVIKNRCLTFVSRRLSVVFCVFCDNCRN